MRYLGILAFAAAAVCLLLTIWHPVGSWWQWAATAVLALFIGAAIESSRAGESR